MAVIGKVLVDGRPVDPEEATVSALDIGFQRGYGCFETIRSYSGFPFRLSEHLDRLEASAAMLRMPLPPRSDLEKWSNDRAGEGDVAIKIFVSGGRDASRPGEQSVAIVFAEDLPESPPSLRLLPLAAPWHPDGRASELTGAKTLSYGPNTAARLEAMSAGFDDALLIGRSGHVLEGPTYSIGWISNGSLCYPSAELCVLASVTAGVVLDIAPAVGLVLRPGMYGLEDALDADEVIVMSTLSEVRPVAAIGDSSIPSGALTPALHDAFAALVESERTRR